MQTMKALLISSLIFLQSVTLSAVTVENFKIWANDKLEELNTEKIQRADELAGKIDAYVKKGNLPKTGELDPVVDEACSFVNSILEGTAAPTMSKDEADKVEKKLENLLTLSGEVANAAINIKQLSETLESLKKDAGKPLPMMKANAMANLAGVTFTAVDGVRQKMDALKE